MLTPEEWFKLACGVGVFLFYFMTIWWATLSRTEKAENKTKRDWSALVTAFRDGDITVDEFLGEWGGRPLPPRARILSITPVDEVPKRESTRVLVREDVVENFMRGERETRQVWIEPLARKRDWGLRIPFEVDDGPKFDYPHLEVGGTNDR